MDPRLTAAVLLVFVAACGDSSALATDPPLITTPTTAPTTIAATPATTPVITTVPSTTIGPSTTIAAATTTTPDATVPIVIEMSFAGGEVSGPDRVEVDKGDLVSLVLMSDVGEEVHIHGYDLFADVAPGATVTLEFEASIQGIFEVELEASRTELTELVVS